ncbi:MAG: hypothetical protein PHC39_04500 [Proteiniphilum sp.]|nr:hypothetical protein [Proteiniphilum sp.]
MSAQSLIGFIIMVVFSAIIFGCSGYVVGNVIIPWGNHFLNGWFLQSQDSYNTAYLILQIFIASPIIALFLWGYDHLNNSNRQSGGDQ